MAAEREIVQALRTLRSLRGRVENFVQFEEEVKETLGSIFERHRTGQNVFERVSRLRIEVGPVIETEITNWLRAVYRRLKARMRARNPWTVNFTRDMPEQIFLSILEVVKKAPSAFGVSHTETNVAYTISYSKETRLLRDFSKLCQTSRESVMSYLSRETKAPRKGNAKITVNTDKPFVLTYMKTKQHVVINCHYTFTNEHGYSFEG